MLLAFEAADREPDPERRRRLLTFVVVGGGPTGVELAGALAELSRYVLARDYRRIGPGDTRVVLVEAGPRGAVVGAENGVGDGIPVVGVGKLLVQLSIVGKDGDPIIDADMLAKMAEAAKEDEELKTKLLNILIGASQDAVAGGVQEAGAGGEGGAAAGPPRDRTSPSTSRSPRSRVRARPVPPPHAHHALSGDGRGGRTQPHASTVHRERAPPGRNLRPHAETPGTRSPLKTLTNSNTYNTKREFRRAPV